MVICDFIFSVFGDQEPTLLVNAATGVAGDAALIFGSDGVTVRQSPDPFSLRQQRKRGVGFGRDYDALENFGTFRHPPHDTVGQVVGGLTVARREPRVGVPSGNRILDCREKTDNASRHRVVRITKSRTAEDDGSAILERRIMYLLYC